MRPAVVFADPERAVIGVLTTAAVADTVSTEAPQGSLGTGTHLQVECDGTPGADYPITERATLRITCYAGRGHRTAVKAMASQAQSALYSWAGSAEVYGSHPLVGRSAVIVDPDTDNLMVWFTFRLDMTPQPAP